MENKAGYTREEIAAHEAKGHVIDAPNQKLHATEDDGAKTATEDKPKANASGIVTDEEQAEWDKAHEKTGSAMTSFPPKETEGMPNNIY